MAASADAANAAGTQSPPRPHTPTAPTQEPCHKDEGARERQKSRSESVLSRMQAAQASLRGLLRAVTSSVEAREAQLDGIWAAHGLPCRPHLTFSVARQLQGHFSKVYALQWDPFDERLMVTVGHDGKLFLWDALAQQRKAGVSISSPWAMTCCLHSQAGLMAAGGLSGTVALYSVLHASKHRHAQTSDGPALARLKGHTGYVSSCTFCGPQLMCTGSGDSTIALWDVSSGRRVGVLEGHTADVLAVSAQAGQLHQLCSASCDGTVRVWDTRTGSCTQILRGHDADVNTAAFLPGGHCLASGSDDSTCRIFDVRAQGAVGIFEDAVLSGTCVTSVAPSASGALLFAGYDDNTLRAWHTCSADMCVQPQHTTASGVSRPSRRSPLRSHSALHRSTLAFAVRPTACATQGEPQTAIPAEFRVWG